MMVEEIRNMADLKKAKELSRNNADAQIQHMKTSATQVKESGRKAILYNIVIPAGIAAGVFLGVRELIRRNRSNNYNVSDFFKLSDPIQEGIAESKKSGRQIDWIQTAIKLAPFIIEVGKRMYDEDEFPFFRKSDSEKNG